MRNALWTAKLDSFTLFVLFAEEIKIVYVRNCYLPLVLRKQQEFQKIRRLSSDLPWKPVVPSVSWIPLDSMRVRLLNRNALLNCFIILTFLGRLL